MGFFFVAPLVEAHELESVKESAVCRTHDWEKEKIQ